MTRPPGQTKDVTTIAKKMLRGHTIPKQTYRVRARVTSGEPLREEATYEIEATNAFEAFDHAGIDGLHYFADDEEAYGHTFAAYVCNRAGGRLDRFDGEFPTP